MAGLEKRDELHRPLGLAAPAPRRRAPYRLVLIGAGAALAVAAGVYFLETDDHLGGEPYAVASVDLHPARPSPAAPDAPGPAAPAPAVAGTASEIENASGVKVVRGNGGAPPGSLVIAVPDTIGLHLAPAPDHRLVDKSRYGLLPRVGADGARPLEVYARPPMLPARLATGAPRVALLVGGLGLKRERHPRRDRRTPGRGVAGLRALWRRDRAGCRRRRARAATKCCCSCRWSPSTIPPTIRAPIPC